MRKIELFLKRVFYYINKQENIGKVMAFIGLLAFFLTMIIYRFRKKTPEELEEIKAVNIFFNRINSPIEDIF